MWPFRKKPEPVYSLIDMPPFAEFMLARQQARQDQSSCGVTVVYSQSFPSRFEDIQRRFYSGWSPVHRPEPDPYIWRDPAELWPEG